MSSNSGVIVNRANQTAPFFAALKSRNSKSLPQLYSSEVNTEAAAQSRVEIESSSASGYSRTMRISLPRYGLLNQLYLHTQFGGTTTTGTAAETNGVNSVPFIGAMAYREIRLMYNGAVLQKFSPFTIVADLWKTASESDKHHLTEMLGAIDVDASGALIHDHNNSGIRTGMKNSGRHLTATAAGSAAVSNGGGGGISDYYLPLHFWFDAKLSGNRALDLSVLANEVILEVDVESPGNIWDQINSSGLTTSTPAINNINAVCYLTELDHETEKQYRSLTYQPGGAPMSQIGYNTEHVIVAGGQAHGAASTPVEVKLNQFTGQVFKLVVFAVLKDDFATNKHRFRPVSIEQIQLKAVGTNIFNQDNLNNKEAILESYRNGGNFTILPSSKAGRADEYVKCNPGHIYELSLKTPMDFSKVSASGSMALGQLSVPSLRVQLNGTAATDFGADANVATAAVDIHVVAYSTCLYSYNTNTSGSTNIRQIAN